MKLRIQDGVVAEIIPDSEAALYPEGSGIYDAPAYLEPYPELVEAVTYDADSSKWGWDKEKMMRAIKALVGQRRWQTESSGIVIEGIGFRIPTSEVAQAKLKSIVDAWKDGDLAETEKVSYVVGESFAVIDLETATKLKRLVTNHVQASFTRQREIFEWVDTLTDSKLGLEKVMQRLTTEMSTWPSGYYTAAGVNAPLPEVTPPTEGAN